MKKCDFLLAYEVRNREAENICLLKYELEKRGYTVLIREMYDTFFNVPEPVNAKVVVVPAYYRDRVRFYASSHTDRVEKIVNLQWEQMLAESTSSQKDSLAAIKPWGFSVMHISWGEDNRNRLINAYGVPEDHVSLTGHIGMDFLREPLKNYYLSRKEVYDQYSIPEDKEICLFISSFAITTMHERFFEGASVSEKEKEEMYEFRRVSIESQKTILEWFDRLLTKDPEKILVYRPHPEERDSEILRDMMEKHVNFRVISDMSVKQWILVSDKILTWASTSVVEVFFAGKTCLILNPVPLPEQMTMELYENAMVTRSWEDFDRSIHGKEPFFPIPSDDINYFYSINESRLSSELVCDTLEKVLEDDKYSLDKPMANPFNGFLNKERILCFVKRAVANSKVCKKIHDKDLFKKSRLRVNIDDILYVKEKIDKNHVSDEEFAEIYARIEKAMTGGTDK